jgi:hypothetical protein
MAILRHSQIAVTMNVYSEVSSPATRKAVRRLGVELKGFEPLAPSMRTTGRVVIHGRSRKCLVRIGLPKVVLRRGGCCTLVLHVSVIGD